MAESGAGEIAASTLTFAHLLLIDGIRAMNRADIRGGAITANTTAHLADEAGRCTLESRARAEQLLGELVACGAISLGECYFIGGDPHQTYVLSELTQPTAEMLAPGQ